MKDVQVQKREYENWNNLHSDIKSSVNVKSSRWTTGDIREATCPKQLTSQDGTSETNGTRLDEPFPEGPYLIRWNQPTSTV